MTFNIATAFDEAEAFLKEAETDVSTFAPIILQAITAVEIFSAGIASGDKMTKVLNIASDYVSGLPKGIKDVEAFLATVEGAVNNIVGAFNAQGIFKHA